MLQLTLFKQSEKDYLSSLSNTGFFLDVPWGMHMSQCPHPSPHKQSAHVPFISLPSSPLGTWQPMSTIKGWLFSPPEATWNRTPNVLRFLGPPKSFITLVLANSQIHWSKFLYGGIAPCFCHSGSSDIEADTQTVWAMARHQSGSLWGGSEPSELDVK